MKDRVFTTKDKDDGDWELKFRRPTQKTMSDAELVYRQMFSVCFRKGILTNAEVEKLLRERDMWDDAKDTEALTIRLKIAELEDKLDKEVTNEEGQSLCAQIGALRMSLQSHNNPVLSVAENTCESIGSEERNQFLVTACIFDAKTGVKVYKDVADFKERADTQAAVDSYKETVIASLEVVMGEDLPSDLDQVYLENRWLAKHASDGEEEEAEEEEKAEVKPKKKRRGRKPKPKATT